MQAQGFKEKIQSPIWLYNKLNLPIWILGSLGFVLLVIGVFWGLLVAPMDAHQGDAYRIIYLHVPFASMTTIIYTLMGLFGISYLLSKASNAGVALLQSAKVGAGVNFVALVSGSIWAIPTWGTWWVWDPRLISVLIMLFLYLGVIALYTSLKPKEVAIKAASILAIAGVLNIPIVKYSVVFWNSIHQTATMSVEKTAMPPSMFLPLILCIFAIMFISFALIALNIKLDLAKKHGKDIFNKN